MLNAPLISSVSSLTTHRSPAVCPSPMARSSLCCPEEANLRQEQGAHPHWEGESPTPLRASHLTQPQLQASGDTFWDTDSYSEKQQHGNSKDEITEAVCHQKCKDRHLSTIVNRITGECSLTDSFPLLLPEALGDLRLSENLQLQRCSVSVLRMRQREMWGLCLLLCACLFNPGSSVTHQAANRLTLGLLARPRSPNVCPGALLRHGIPLTRILRTYDFLLLPRSCPWDCMLLWTPQRPVWPMPQGPTGREKTLKSTHLPTGPLHSQTDRWIPAKYKKNLNLEVLKN